MQEPIITRSLHGGAQKLYRFANGYGASVVRNEFSYGGWDGKWELAVIKWVGEDFDLVYDTPVTDDVIGRCDDDDIAALLDEIERLPVAV